MSSHTTHRPVWYPDRPCTPGPLVAHWEQRLAQITVYLRDISADAAQACACGDVPALTCPFPVSRITALLRESYACTLRETIALLRADQAQRIADPDALVLLLAAEQEARTALVVLGSEWYATEQYQLAERRAVDWAAITNPDDLPMAIIGATGGADPAVAASTRPRRRSSRVAQAD